MGTQLIVEHLRKEYPTPGEPLVVLADVCLTLSAGQSLAVVGPSGSGKSTLLNILGTLDTPTRGRVLHDGVDPFALTARGLAGHRARQVGFVFQDHHLLPQCSAIENVLLPRLALARAGRDDVARGRELLCRVGLGDRMTHLPSELSGGERQRVAIARALVNRPGLLLCDEPTGNLDARRASEVGQLLLEVAAETSAILVVVTHSAPLAKMFAQRAPMVDGRLLSASGDQARLG